jgi:hypothetical protein
VVALIVIVGLLRSTALQVIGIVLMALGAWWLGEWSSKRFPTL